ncbi:phenoloxidase-activating factor 2-like [Maniola hyperantus]|uniref:phenoloxidase-activating factor 2-like n=1 Tax=Aphantopus hyperantus TaxID=2795564 RepID=UPI00211FA9D5
MRLQAVPILMVTLAICSADNIRWHTIKTTPSTAPVTCYTQQQNVGICVKASMCDLAPPQIDPASLFSYRMQSKSANECTFLETCCPRDKVRLEPVPPSLQPPPGCGYTNAGRERAGTGNADFTEFPWIVALLRNNNQGGWYEYHGDHLGGGALIHPSVVLTAASSVWFLHPSALMCRAGEWKTKDEEEPYVHQDRLVERIIVHEQRGHHQYLNNVALLLMVTPFVIQPNINVACLSPTMPPPGTLCYSMDWEDDSFTGDYYTRVQKKLTLFLVDQDECETKKHPDLILKDLNHSLTCAMMAPDVHTSLMNGGMPLVCPAGNPADLRYTLVGLTTYGLGREGPIVYTKLPEFYDWVNSQLSKQQISDRPYNLNSF